MYIVVATFFFIIYATGVTLFAIVMAADSLFTRMLYRRGLAVKLIAQGFFLPIMILKFDSLFIETKFCAWYHHKDEASVKNIFNDKNFTLLNEID